MPEPVVPSPAHQDPFAALDATAQADLVARGLAPDAFLPRFKTEAVAQLEQKAVQLVQQLILELGFTHDFCRFQAKKLEDVGVTNRQRRNNTLCAFLRQD